jgi:hypothetical protein
MLVGPVRFAGGGENTTKKEDFNGVDKAAKVVL